MVEDHRVHLRQRLRQKQPPPRHVSNRFPLSGRATPSPYRTSSVSRGISRLELVGIVGTITVDRTDDFGFRDSDSRQNGGRDSLVDLMTDYCAILAVSEQILERRPRFVTAAVVDEDES